MNHFVVAYAEKEWQLYVGIAFGALSMAVTTLCRSSMSKLVEPDEIGKVFSVVGALQVREKKSLGRIHLPLKKTLTEP